MQQFKQTNRLEKKKSTNKSNNKGNVLDGSAYKWMSDSTDRVVELQRHYWAFIHSQGTASQTEKQTADLKTFTNILGAWFGHGIPRTISNCIIHHRQPLCVCGSLKVRHCE